MHHARSTLALVLLLTLAGCGGGGGTGGSRRAAAAAVSSANLPPHATVVTPAGPARGVVLLDYTLRDETSDPSTVAVDWSADAGLTWRAASRAVGQGDATSGLATSPAGFGYAFAWDAPADVGPVRATCRLRLTPSDATGAGAAAVTGDLVVDLSPATPAPPAPGAPAITRLRPTLGARQASVVVRGANFMPDPAQNDVRFDGLPATLVSATADELVVAVPAAVRLGDVPVTVVSGGVLATPPVTFRVLPDPTLTRVAPAAAAVGDTVTLEGTTFDDTRPDGVVVRFTGASVIVTAASGTRVDVVVPAGARTGPVYVVTHGASTGGVPFSVGAAPAPGTDDHGDDAGHATPIQVGQTVPGRTDLANDQDWFSVPLRAGRAYTARTSALQGGMDTVLAVHDPAVAFVGENDDESSSALTSRVDFTAAVDGVHYLKVRHYRGSATSGSYAVTVSEVTPGPAPAPTPSPAPNAAPHVLMLTTPSGTQAGPVAVSFTLVDADADRVDLRAEYRLGGGAWTPATRHATSDPQTGLAASPGGATYRFVWASDVDTGAYTGGANLRLVPTDARGAVGGPAATQAFALSNAAAAPPPSPAAPSAPVVVSVGTPQGTQRGPVTIPVVVADADAEPVDLVVEYMLSATSGWRPATLHATSASTRGVAATAAGAQVRVVWDAAADLGRVLTPAVIVRVAARDGRGLTSVPRVTGSFAVDDR